MSCHCVPNFLKRWIFPVYHNLPCCCSINQWFPFLSFTKENVTGKCLGTFWHFILRPAELLMQVMGICPGVGRHHLLVTVSTGSQNWIPDAAATDSQGTLGKSLSPQAALYLQCRYCEMRQMPAGILAAVDVWCRWTQYFPVSDVCETTRQSFLKPLIHNISCVILVWTGSYAKNYYSWSLYSWREWWAGTSSREFPMHNWSGRNEIVHLQDGISPSSLNLDFG